MTIEELKKLRKDLLNKRNRLKKYVTVTPYIERPEGRFRVDAYTCLDYTEEAIANKVDNEGALEYILELLKKRAGSDKDDLDLTTLECTLSYFVDSRLHTDKDYRRDGTFKEVDFLPHLFAISVGTVTEQDQKLHTERKTFVVDMDDFISLVEDSPININFGFKNCSSKILIDTVVKRGFAASPRMEIERGYFENTALKDKQTKHL